MWYAWKRGLSTIFGSRPMCPKSVGWITCGRSLGAALSRDFFRTSSPLLGEREFDREFRLVSDGEMESLRFSGLSGLSQVTSMWLHQSSQM